MAIANLGRKRSLTMATALLLLPNAATAFNARPSPEALIRPATRQFLGKFDRQGFASPTESTSADDASSFLPARRQQKQRLRAVKVGTLSEEAQDNNNNDKASQDLKLSESEIPSSSLLNELWPVLSAASLVTGSTVGAAMLSLPSLAAGPGLVPFSALMSGAFLLCLISGLVIADVAINQHETSGSEVPSSFKEFAEVSLDNELLAKAVSAIPVLVNSLVAVYDISKGGELVSSVLSPLIGCSIDPMMASAGFVVVLGTFLTCLSGANLSTLASMCVSTFFVAFAGLLIPGLVGVQDPVGAIMAPGTDEDLWLNSVVAAAPIVLTALQFQNVVPSITKILKYDRRKTVASISLGSFIPLVMYTAWCYAVLGGGIDTANVAGPLMVIFSGATIFGSSIGASMSVTEEVENYVTITEAEDQGKSEDFSLPAVMIALAVPMAGVVAFSNGAGDVTAALGVAGAYGSPLLYGVIPALMAINQRKKANFETEPVVPGGLASIGTLGVAAAVFVGQGLAHNVNDLLSAGMQT